MGRPIGGDDLLQEAFRRALDGERKCPISIDAVRFLAEAMRSIADGELKKTQRQPVLVPLPGPGDAETAIAEPADPRSTAEELIGGEQEADRLRSEILSLFNDDQIAQIIVEGIMEDIEGEELRSLTSLDKTQFDSKRRLIRRRISKYLRG